MSLEFSHIMAFSALFINSMFDVFSEKGDVPSVFSVIAILGGIVLHSLHAWSTGSLTPLIWMAVIGLAFSLYGWFAYWAGMWGGADALAMTVLGFTAPYSVNGIGVVYGFSLFANIFIVSSIYAAGYTGYKAIKSDKLRGKALERIQDRKKYLAVQLIGAVTFSVIQTSFNPFLVFGALTALIALYHLVKEVEDTEMSQEIAVEDVEEGDVIETEDLELGHREKNLVGQTFDRLDNWTAGRISETRLGVLEERLGYSDIVGVTEEELEELEEKDINEVKVKEGLRLVPVFPIALVLTEAGLTIITIFTVL